MFTLQVTDGEMYEIGDAIAPALERLLSSGDPNNYEAKYGSASNLVSVIRKIWEARSPENIPDWLPEFEARVAALRSAKSGDLNAANAVPEFKTAEARLKPLFTADGPADSEGIRVFDLGAQSSKNG